LSSHSRGSQHRGADAGAGSGKGGKLVKVGFARNQSEAEMIQGLLRDAGIPSMLKRSGGFDNPDFLAAGPHDLLVVSDLAEKARGVLADTMVESEPEARREIDEAARLRREGTETSPGRLALWVAAAFLGAVILVWVLYQLS
jgi:hypothetical protein